MRSILSLRIPLLVAACATLPLAACGEGETGQTAAATPAATIDEIAAESTVEPTPTPTVDPDCDVGAFVIHISGGTGISCKNAKKIYTAFTSDRKVPSGWKCELQACTKVHDDGTVQDFDWRQK